jgi:hypothetical protein
MTDKFQSSFFMRPNWNLLIILVSLLVATEFPYILPAVIAYLAIYFSFLNVFRMEDINELKELNKKNEDTSKKLAASLKVSNEEIKVLRKKVTDLQQTTKILAKKKHQSPVHVPVSVEKQVINPDWHMPEFAMKSPNKTPPPSPTKTTLRDTRK